MRLQPGIPAPSFKMADIEGNEVDLSSYKGGKVLLSFFRGAPCPFCNLRIHELTKKYNEIQNNGLNVITFFTSDKESIMKYPAKLNPPFPIIPDPDLTIYKKYGVEKSLMGMFKAMGRVGSILEAMRLGVFSMRTMTDSPVVPADFLLNEKLEIEKSHYGKDFGDHIKLEEIL